MLNVSLHSNIFSKDAPSLLLKAEIVTFACLSYYVTCHIKIYQSKIRDFFVFLGILLDFSPLIPTPTHFSGYHACFFSPIPILTHFSGYHDCFSSLIPTPTHSSGYHAYFSCSHTHSVSFVWVSHLLFPLSYPHRLTSLGITLAFSPSIPTTSILSKIA